MRRWLRVLLIVAPAIALFLGVPAGVALARHTTPLSAPAGAFIGPRPFVGPRLPASTAQNGVAGVITRVGPGRIVVYTRAKKLAVIQVDARTTIRSNGKNIKIADLRPGDRVTVLGARTTAGAFHAQLIRAVHPAPDPRPGNAR